MENESKLNNKVEHSPETQEVSQETGLESEANAIKGAEMLENPPDGSFVQGLQLFIAWVKSLVADDK